MELVNVYSTGRTVDFQKYEDKDNQLIVSSYTNTEMDPNADSVELTAYGESGEFLDYNPTITTFKVAQGNVNPVTGFYTKIELDPKRDINALGLTRGRVNAQYNFLKPLFASSNVSKYWIKEISPSGTELKLSSQNLSNEQIRTGFLDFQNYSSTKNYFVDFYLNFGENRLLIANNAILSEEDGEVYLLIKLYEPIPDDFGVKDSLWICDRVADSVIYTIDTQIVEDTAAPQNALRGPNNRIKVRERVGQTTPYYSYASLFSSTVSSSMQQLLSYYQDKAIEINVDYSDFSNFIHFSSATERLNNFVYKLGLIEQYNAEITDTQAFASMSPGTLTIVSQSNALAQQNIDNLINKFDTYEYYLYFSSESFAWPKSTSTKPYQLYSVTSSEAIAWLGNEYIIPTANAVSMLYSASFYDNRNANKLSNAIPQYLLEDPTNEPYVTFIDMIGQHFDNVWLYYKDLSNRYSSFNSPNLGLSKDMVADALRGFGFNLYTNTSVSDNLYYTLFGMNADGSFLPPTGSEIITDYVTSSIDTLSPKQLDAEVYKRMYHNLTYLLKTKGTQRGVKALVACYGIPEEILDVNEFGGNNRNTGSGIYEINDQKINYFTQSAELSNPVLSPYVTLQQYNTNYRLNTNDIETAFSPADQINKNFVSSSGFVNMDQLIGDPEHQYLTYYPSLKTVRDNYFASYSYPHSVWEYIRIIKYYNNSLFKTIKDWVPSKANSSTGIVVKSHILERNKYARTEPNMSFDNNISESIDMVSIDGSAPGAVKGNTVYTEALTTPLGEVRTTYTEGRAKFTGRFSGSSIQVTTGEAFDQSDYATTPSGSVEVDYPANYQNVLTINRSKRFFELDYNFNQNVATNFGLVTMSISNSIDNNFNTYNDPYSPYADIQDYNYYTRAFTDFRYFGSKTKSLVYNTYTAPVSGGYEGDSSYGLAAAIDRNSNKVGWVKNFQRTSLNFNDKTSITLKYLVDEDQNLVELNLRNLNLFDVQNIFKSGENVIVSLSDILKPSFQKTLDGTKKIFRGGFSYDPILFREGNENLNFLFPGGSRSRTIFLGYKGVETDFGYFFIGDLYQTYFRNNFQRGIDQFLETFKLTEFANTQFGFDAYTYINAGQATRYLGDGNESSLIAKNLGGLSQAPNWNIQYIYANANTFDSHTRLAASFSGVSGIGRITDIFTASPTRQLTDIAPLDQTGYGVFTRQNDGSRYWMSYYAITTNRTIQQSGVYKSREFDSLDINGPRVHEIKIDEIFGINFNYTGSGGGYYTEDSDVRPGNVLFECPRDNSTYTISMQVPIGITLSYYRSIGSYASLGNGNATPMPYQIHGVAFKVFFILEKLEAGSTDWSIVGSTYINKVIDQSQSNIQYDNPNNVVYFAGGQGSGYFDNRASGDQNEMNTTVELRMYNPDQDPNKRDRIELTLNRGDRLRLRFFIIDMDRFFGLYGRNFGMGFGLFGTGGFINYNPYFEIVDKSVPKTFFDQTVVYSGTDTFRAQDNQLIFSEDFTEYFVSTSIFLPTGSTADFYSNVIDQLSLQPGDLIRIGQFKNPEPQYFNVVSSSYSFATDLIDGETLSTQVINNINFGAIFQPNRQWIVDGQPQNKSTIILTTAEGVNQNAFDFFNKVLNSTSKQFEIENVRVSSTKYPIDSTSLTDLRNRLEKRYTITDVKRSTYFEQVTVQETVFISITGPFGQPIIISDTRNVVIQIQIPVVEVAVNPAFEINTTNFIRPFFERIGSTGSDGKWTEGVACNFVAQDTLYTPTLVATLDRPVPTTLTKITQNFAILRPKPDETSVIVDFKKFDGDVSQAILIPEDASKAIKDKVGDIYKALNTDLSQQQLP